MSARTKHFFFKLKQIGFFVPFTIYFLAFALVTFLGYRWLNKSIAMPESSYKDIFKLLLSLSLFVCASVLCLGFIATCVAFAYFKWKQRKGEVVFRISTAFAQENKGNKQQVSIFIQPILQPLLGFIRIRLNYDETHVSAKFNLVRNGRLNLISTTLEGTYQWELPEIREYRIEKVILYFEDFFQFFSLASTVYANNTFYTPPEAQQLGTVNTFPRKTEEQNTRIEELRKIEGEYINYKNFESSDDVRRIVWKIYAKNKELVIRIPEILDPYASHIYLYASFFSKFDVKGNEVVEVPFLNYYKTVCWSLYEQLSKKGFEVRYIPDQPVAHTPPGEENRTRYALTVSSWQQDTPLKTYVDPRDAAIVLLSSLSDPDEVRELTERHGNAITFIMVPLGESLDSLNFTHWLKWLFVQQGDDRTASYRSSWNLSPLRLRIEQNERLLSELLKDQQKIAIV